MCAHDIIVEMYVILSIFNIIIGVNCFRTDLMHEHCGSIIDGEPGEIIFDANELLAHTRSCGVTLTRKTRVANSNETYRLLFYFNEFDRQKDCNGSIFRIFDPNILPESTESGMMMTLCGSNQTAVTPGVIFTTPGDRINVSFLHFGRGRQHPGRFTLVYSQFHTGICDTVGEVECSQEYFGRICVPLNFICARKMNICLEINDSQCSFNTSREETSTEYFKYILCALSGIFVIFGINFFYRQYQKGRSRDERCWAKIKKNLFRRRRNYNENGRNSVASIVSSSNPVYDAQAYGTNATTEHNSEDSVIQGNLTVVPSAPTLEEFDLNLPLHLPPSYDETVVPPYNEVMTHRDKYSVH